MANRMVTGMVVRFFPNSIMLLTATSASLGTNSRIEFLNRTINIDRYESGIKTETAQATQDKSRFPLGSEYYFKSSVVGKFTSYGGVVTPINRKMLNILKVLTEENESTNELKIGSWFDKVAGEPKYVLDAQYEAAPLQYDADLKVDKVLRGSGRYALIRISKAMSKYLAKSGEEIFEPTALCPAEDWFILDFSGLTAMKCTQYMQVLSVVDGYRTWSVTPNRRLTSSIFTESGMMNLGGGQSCSCWCSSKTVLYTK
jgi:hypothetical protein